MRIEIENNLGVASGGVTLEPEPPSKPTPSKPTPPSSTPTSPLVPRLKNGQGEGPAQRRGPPSGGQGKRLRGPA